MGCASVANLQQDLLTHILEKSGNECVVHLRRASILKDFIVPR